MIIRGEKAMVSRLAHHDLTAQLRQYASETRVIQLCPTQSVLEEAIAQYFPERMTQGEELDRILESLGIVVIEDLGHGIEPKRISWSITDDLKEAQAQLQEYLQPPYQGLRKALGIDFHWIFYVPNHDLLEFNNEELQEAIGEFRADGQPECWICDWFRSFE